MTLPGILSLATGVPGAGYDQAEIFDYLQPLFDRTRHARFIFNRAGIERRFMAANREFYQRPQGTEARNLAYMEQALPLGEDTIARCLAAAGISAGHVDDFFVVSCRRRRSGPAAGRRMHMRPTCGGRACWAWAAMAPSGLQRARAVAHQPGRVALVLALELCSLHLQADIR
jgi:predicted naringenin-chalcone synthase